MCGLGLGFGVWGLGVCGQGLGLGFGVLGFECLGEREREALGLLGRKPSMFFASM